MTATKEEFITPIGLDRDTFMRRLIASLGHLNEGILGSDVAGAYIMNVGLSMGAAIEAEYKRFWGLDRPFTLDEYAHVIVDLKQKIKGNFSLVSKDPTKVLVRTTSCPFDEFVRQSPSLCFMTSSVFGGIAARNFGYAKVVLHKRIALGDPGCYVTVYLQRTPEAEAAVGKEYFPHVDRASPDIAEQLHLMESLRRLRQQLGETSSRWQELVRGAAEAICVLSPEGTIGFANARWRELLGVESDELVGGTFEHIVHREDREGLRAALEQGLGGERVVGQYYRLRHRNGTWRDVLASIGSVRDEQHRIVGALGIFLDVTEEREAQRLKDEFLATASHELRTPVTTIRWLTELMLRTLQTRGSIEPDQLARRLELIRQEADRLALLGVDLLDAARLQAGRLAMRLEQHDLNDIVEVCVRRQLELLNGSTTHRVRYQPSPTPVFVRVERARLEQVIANLLDNAVKYSPEGGEVLVETEVHQARAEVSIRDQGIGIPQHEIPKLFTPFFRSSNASSRHFNGLGLGLYLSRGIVEAHGGHLTVESVQWEGTLVTLSLPCAEVEMQ